MKILLLTLSILFSCSGWAQLSWQMDSRPEPQKLALDYIKAVTDRNYRKLKRYYSRDSLFEDKTAGRSYTGSRNILMFLKRSHAGVKEYRFEIEHLFNNGGFVVLIGTYYLKADGRAFGKPGRVIDVSVPAVTTLNVDVSKTRVNTHVDLLDYDAMREQLALQQ